MRHPLPGALILWQMVHTHTEPWKALHAPEGSGISRSDLARVQGDRASQSTNVQE